MQSLAFFTLLACFLTPPSLLNAQAVVIPGVTSVGSSSPPLSVTLSLANGGTIATVKLLGQGSPNVDFVNNGGTCARGTTVLPGNTCNLSVIFKPASPGPRSGAVVLLDGGNNVLATQLLAGSATGSVGVFVPGIINTVAGDFNWVYVADGRTATSSPIFLPFGVAVDAAGDLIIADSSNNRIRRVDAGSGLMSTVAGNGIVGSTGDGGPATSATIDNPTSVALDPAGNIYFSDSGNDAIRRVDAFTGLISTVAGTLGKHGYTGDNGPATSASFNSPNGISFDPNGNLYIADTGNHAIRVVNPSGIIATVAGTGTAGFSGDNGPATRAQLNAPWSATPIPPSTPGVDVGFYIADQNNNRIRAVDASGNITTIAGTNGGYSGDTGPATSAQLSEPASVLVDVAGNIYIADSGNNVVRRINPQTAIITTFAGNNSESFTGDGGPANKAGFYGPYAFALDTQGNLYIADVFHNRIREVAANTAILNYPVMRVDRVSAPLTQTIENDGNAPLDITLLNPVLYAQFDPGTTTCGTATPIASLDQCAVGLDFAPTVTGTLVTGEADIDSNAGNSPGKITLTGQVLDVNPTVTSVTSNLNPSSVGQPVVFTATVTSSGQTPTGAITLLDGTTTIGSGTLNSSASATFTISNFTSGSHSITAAYAGDSQNAAAVSAVLTQVVKQANAATTTVLSSNVNTAIAGTPIVFTANVNIVTADSGNGNITGSVAIVQGSNTLGTATINSASATASNGVATMSLTDLPVGTDNITAVYAGNGSYSGSTSAPIVETIQLATSITALSAATPSYAGAAVVLTANLTSNGATPTGSVQFLDGTTNLGSAPISAQGVASLSVAGRNWTVGSHSLTAVYAGDKSNSASTSAPFSEIVNIAPTSTTVLSSLNPAGLGANVIFTATVTSSGGSSTGSVQFFDGAASLGSGNLTSAGASSATASFPTAALTLGTHTITAVYSGDSFDSTSTSAAFTETIDNATIGITLRTSATPVVFGSPLTLTATVTGNGSAPSGTVNLQDSGATVATLPVPSNGIVSFNNPSLAIGQHSLTAAYSGDANHAAATSAVVNQTIQQATTTALTASNLKPIAGTSVTLSATVTGVSGKPFTGNVSFTDAGALLASVAAGAGGVATLTTANLAPGQHTIIATYAGDTLDATSSSTSVAVVVTDATTTTTLSTSANPINTGASLTLSSTVQGNGGTPTGTVTFHDGGTVLTSVQVASTGTATFSISTLAPGIHQLSASYSGDTDDSASTSPTTAEQVVQKTSVTLASSENPSLLQDSVAITIAVGNGSTAAVPTGSVVLMDGTTQLASLLLNGSGTATYTFQAPAVGTHTLVANYAGDNQNSPASSQPLLQIVNLRPTTVSFSSSSTAISSGQQITLISVVKGTGSTPPTGTVSWVSGATTLGSAPIDSTGLATVTITPPQGSFATVAQYSGDSLYASSVSPAISIIVGPTTEFTISASPSSLSMASGDHGTVNIDIATASTFADTLALGCAGLPTDATCTFSVNQIPVAGGAAPSLSVIVDTGHPLGAEASAQLRRSGISNTYACTLPAGAFLALLLFFERRRLRRINPRLALFTIILLLGVGSTVLSGCGSDLNVAHTPAGKYSFQIVGIGNKTSVTSSATVQLTVTK
jgi:hypothetical protein